MNAPSLRVLFVAAEAFPMAKAGGLGDVAGALPIALRRRGVDVRLMMPADPSAMQHVHNARSVMQFDDVQSLGAAHILEAETLGNALPVWLVASQRMFERPGGPYADDRGVPWPDQIERFALFCNAATRFIDRYDQWSPELIHLNDWHTSLIAALLPTDRLRPATLLTIHNAAFQGHASLEQLLAFGVPDEVLRATPPPARSFLGVGVCLADRLSTVSPTYAKEIQTKAFGWGLERLYASRARALIGVLNGVDYSTWDPARDANLAQPYDSDDIAGKARDRASLLDEMKLDTSSFAPVLGIVSRMTAQKGLDLVLRVADIFVTAGARIVALGQGDPALEQGLQALAARYPNRVAANIRYDEALAHRIIAGSDIFLMPSRFEPCGLNQMYSQRYGTVPVVGAVGGLVDSVTDAGQRGIATGVTTGFKMRGFGPASLTIAAGKAMAVYPDRQLWKQLQRNGMRQDFSWDRAAGAYHALYSHATGIASLPANTRVSRTLLENDDG